MVMDVDNLLAWSARQRAALLRRGSTRAAEAALEFAASNFNATKLRRYEVAATVTLQRWLRRVRRRKAWHELINNFIGYGELMAEVRAARELKEKARRQDAEAREVVMKDYVSSRRQLHRQKPDPAVSARVCGRHQIAALGAPFMGAWMEMVHDFVGYRKMMDEVRVAREARKQQQREDAVQREQVLKDRPPSSRDGAPRLPNKLSRQSRRRK